jgi:hypothetical protein
MDITDYYYKVIYHDDCPSYMEEHYICDTLDTAILLSVELLNSGININIPCVELTRDVDTSAEEILFENSCEIKFNDHISIKRVGRRSIDSTAIHVTRNSIHTDGISNRLNATKFINVPIISHATLNKIDYFQDVMYKRIYDPL